MATGLEGTFYGGWLAQQQANRAQDQQTNQNNLGNLGMLAKIQQMQQEKQIRAIVAGPEPMQVKAQKLAQVPGGIEIASKMMQLDEKQREAAVFSPENIAANTTGGTPAVPARAAEQMPAGVEGPPVPDIAAQPAVPGKVNLDELRRQAAPTSTRALEAYSTHVANEENRKATIAATRESALARLAQQQQNNDLLHETRLARLTNDKDKLEEVKRHNRVAEGLLAQNAALNAEMRRQGLELRAMQFRQGNDQQSQRQLMQLAAALDRANLPEADAVLGEAEKVIAETPQLSEYISGVNSLRPDFAVPVEIRKGRQALQKLFNITLKQRSGAAVTKNELDRLKAEFGSGAFKTKDQLQNAVTAARDIVTKHYAGIAAGFSPQVLDAYNENVRQFGGNVVLGSGQPSAPASEKVIDVSELPK